MALRKSRCVLVALMMVTGLLVVLATWPAARAEDGSPYYNRLWQWLEQNNYRHWSDVPGANGDFRASTSPHGDYVKIYVNRTAASEPDQLSNGAVLVVENYTEDRELISVNVMQRAGGFDRNNGNWYYATYLPGGRVAKALGKRGEIAFAGKVSSCIECHRNAWDDDFVYFND